MLKETHLVHSRPVIHCSGCENPMVFPHARELNSARIRSGQAVLAECTKCSVAVEVPASMFRPSEHVSTPKVVARVWGTPQAKLSADQKSALKLTDEQLTGLGIGIE